MLDYCWIRSFGVWKLCGAWRMGTIGSRLLVFERELQKRLTCRRRLRGEFMHVVVHNMLCDISNFPKQLNNSSLQLMAFHISHVSLLIIIVLYFRWGPYQIEVPVHSLNCCSYFILHLHFIACSGYSRWCASLFNQRMLSPTCRPQDQNPRL
jgi:hypothetical protein